MKDPIIVSYRLEKLKEWKHIFGVRAVSDHGGKQGWSDGGMEMKARLELGPFTVCPPEAPIRFVSLGKMSELPRNLVAVRSQSCYVGHESLVIGPVQQGEQPKKRSMPCQVVHITGTECLDQKNPCGPVGGFKLALEKPVTFQAMPRRAAAALV